MRTLRYALRALLAQPALSAGIVLSLALAIGANTAIFGLADEILWKPLPVRAPDRLVAIHGFQTKAGGYVSTSYPDFQDYRDGTGNVFSALAAFVRVPVLLEGRTAERVAAEFVSANYFDAVGVAPLAGRAFVAEDETTERPVALVSERLWQRRLEGDPIALGQPIVIHGYPVTVIGVVPARYRGTLLDWVDPPDLWLPAPLFERALPAARDTDLLTRRDARAFVLVGRLRDGIEAGAAQAAVTTVASRMAATFPSSNTGMSAVVTPAQYANFWPAHRAGVTRSLLIFSGAVGLVLLLACTNIANLLLERASARRKEVAIRLAIGATRGALVRQLMAESLLLAAAGALLGLGFARLLSTALASSTRPLGVRLAVQLPLDYRVLAFTAALALVTALLFGLLPAIRASRSSLVSALKGSEPAWDFGIRLFSLRHVLVVVQVAISLVLLVSGGLVARSLVQTYRTEPGFPSDGLIVMSLDLSARDDGEGRNRRTVQQAIERIGALPGVQGVSQASQAPFSGTRAAAAILPDGAADPAQALAAEFTEVGPDYFRTLGVPVTDGREFSAGDVAVVGDDSASPRRIAIINETLARRLFGGGRAAVAGNSNAVASDAGASGAGSSGAGASVAGLGDVVGRSVRRVNRNGSIDRFDVIGVARTIPYHRMWEEPIPMMYVPAAGRLAGTTLLVRSAGTSPAIVQALREVVARLDPLAVTTIRTVREQLTESIQPQRVAASLLGLFSVCALVLASVGLYSVLTYAVAQRTREIGLRIALGAEPPRVLRQVVARGLGLAAVGLLAGLGLAALATPLLASMMPGVPTRDPITFAVVSGVLLIVAALASVRPARRAARVDPLIALRTE